MKPLFYLTLLWFVGATSFSAINQNFSGIDLKKYMAGLEEKSAKGDGEAKLELAQLHSGGARDSNGYTIQSDMARGLQIVREASDAGVCEAWVRLANLYAAGVGEPRHNGEKPSALFEKAAARGHPRAMNELAYRYQFGLAVEKDLLMAAGWRARAELVSGEGPDDDFVNQNGEEEEHFIAETARLFVRSIRRGSAEGLLRLAELHMRGERGKPNFPRAAGLFRLAGALGNKDASAKALQLIQKFDERDREAQKMDMAWMRAP